MPNARADYMQKLREEHRARGIRRVSVTLDSDEFTRLSVLAKRQNEAPTAHLKRRAFAHMDERYLVPADVSERLDSLVAILRGIGNNLNQLARHSNEMRYFLDTESVRLQVKRLEEEISTFIQAPNRAETPSGDSSPSDHDHQKP
jgi:hypothetical protein